jgi:hypothetical protein
MGRKGKEEMGRKEKRTYSLSCSLQSLPLREPSARKLNEVIMDWAHQRH